MRRIVGALLILALAACSTHGTGDDTTANQAAMFVAAPCPAPDATDPLAGIEGWAPGAGQASKMADNAQANMGAFGGGLGGGAPATATPSPASTGDCRTFSPWLSDRLGKFADLRKQLPQSSYDVSAAAATLTTPDAAFAFVRDAIRTEPYAGAMRGARGTLASKAGSPADKAQLLHDLLAAQNVTTRFAHATLTAADATTLLASATAATTIDPKAIVASQPARDAMAAGIASALSQATTVASLLAAHHTAIASDGALYATLGTNLTDHWWLQAQIGGAWIDMDPSLPTAKSGTHLGPAASDTPDALPAAIQDTVAVRLVADTGGATPQVLAQARSTAADAVEQPILVQMNGDATDAATIATQTAFVPSIAIGDAVTTGDSFSPDASGARMQALYLEIETDVPGQKPSIHRHTIVDRRGADGTGIDPAWTIAKTAYAMAFAYGGLEGAGDGDPVYDANVSIDALLRGALAADYAALHPDATILAPGADSSYPYEVHRFFQYDAGIRGAFQQADPTLTWTFQRPMIAFLSRSFDLRSDGLHIAQTFDIVDNGAVAIAGGKTAGTVNLERGIMDTSVEGALVTGPGEHLDTAAVFAAAKGAGIATTVLGAGDVATAPVASRDALGTSLTATTVALAPASAPTVDGVATYGWLEVDTATGSAVGRMRSGAGQAMTERSILEKAVERYSDIKGIGRCINCFMSAMGEALTSSKQHGQHFMSCMADALCQWVVDRTFDWLLVHGFEFEGTGMNLVSGPYADIAGEVLKGGPTGAICNGAGSKNPYSCPIIG